MDKSHWLDRPRNVNLLRRTLVGVLALPLIAEALLTLHPHFAIESVFAFYAWYGLMACVLMIVVAKTLAILLKRPDSYYDERDD